MSINRKSGNSLLLPLSRDKGTQGQEKFFVPGQRDNGTSRPVETLVDSQLIKVYALEFHTGA